MYNANFFSYIYEGFQNSVPFSIRPRKKSRSQNKVTCEKNENVTCVGQSVNAHSLSLKNIETGTHSIIDLILYLPETTS
jgi:hypothetical protein